MSSTDLPSYVHQRTPGPWAWSDFRDPVQRRLNNPGVSENVSTTRPKTYLEQLTEGWKNEKLIDALPKAESCLHPFRINPIDLMIGGEVERPRRTLAADKVNVRISLCPLT